MEMILKMAVRIAEDAHCGQFDKAGNPYIGHPMRVMNNVHSIEEKIVAILHDVMEDTDVTSDDLRQAGIPDSLISELNVLIRSPNMDYDKYIERISHFSIASAVKLADLKDNMDITRLNEITEKDIERLRIYHRSYVFLKNKQNT